MESIEIVEACDCGTCTDILFMFLEKILGGNRGFLAIIGLKLFGLFLDIGAIVSAGSDCSDYSCDDCDFDCTDQICATSTNIVTYVMMQRIIAIVICVVVRLNCGFLSKIGNSKETDESAEAGVTGTGDEATPGTKTTDANIDGKTQTVALEVASATDNEDTVSKDDTKSSNNCCLDYCCGCGGDEKKTVRSNFHFGAAWNGLDAYSKLYGDSVTGKCGHDWVACLVFIVLLGFDVYISMAIASESNFTFFIGYVVVVAYVGQVEYIMVLFLVPYKKSASKCLKTVYAAIMVLFLAALSALYVALIAYTISTGTCDNANN